MRCFAPNSRLTKAEHLEKCIKAQEQQTNEQILAKTRESFVRDEEADEENSLNSDNNSASKQCLVQ